jgi:hypothetical protein
MCNVKEIFFENKLFYYYYFPYPWSGEYSLEHLPYPCTNKFISNITVLVKEVLYNLVYITYSMLGKCAPTVYLSLLIRWLNLFQF